MYQSSPENDHSKQNFDGGAGTTRIEHHEADTARADNDFDRDQRAPAVTEPVAQGR